MVLFQVPLLRHDVHRYPRHSISARTIALEHGLGGSIEYMASVCISARAEAALSDARCDSDDGYRSRPSAKNIDPEVQRLRCTQLDQGCLLDYVYWTRYFASECHIELKADRCGKPGPSSLQPHDHFRGRTTVAQRVGIHHCMLTGRSGGGVLHVFGLSAEVRSAGKHDTVQKLRDRKSVV